MFIGRELAYHDRYSLFQRWYIRLLGVPIVGLRIRARNVFSLIPKNRQYREILDAGSGLGVFSFQLARLFPASSVTGVDVLKDEVESAEHIRKKAGIENVRFKVADLVSIPDSNRFDLVLCIDILEHIQDDAAAIRGIYRALAPEGLLVLHVPALYRRYPVWKKSLNFDVETHVRKGYELQEIQDKIRDANFTLLESGYTYGFLETLANNLSYMITRARMENKHLYALAFPFLNVLSWLGARARPGSLGAGIFVVAEKRST
jgi:SAM-dependent methyltransferase